MSRAKESIINCNQAGTLTLSSVVIMLPRSFWNCETSVPKYFCDIFLILESPILLGIAQRLIDTAFAVSLTCQQLGLPLAKMQGG